MKYAFITGDEYTRFEPVVFVFANGKFEVICESSKRQQSYYDYLRNNKFEDLDSLLKTFSYQNVETGDVTPDVESMLNTLRAKFGLSQIADQELENSTQQSPEDSRRLNALMRISKRMRTGANER